MARENRWRYQKPVPEEDNNNNAVVNDEHKTWIVLEEESWHSVSTFFNRLQVWRNIPCVWLMRISSFLSSLLSSFLLCLIIENLLIPLLIYLVFDYWESPHFSPHFSPHSSPHFSCVWLMRISSLLSSFLLCKRQSDSWCHKKRTIMKWRVNVV